MNQFVQIGSPEFNQLLNKVAEAATETAIKVLKNAMNPEYVDKAKALEMLGRKPTSNLHKLIVSGDIKISKDGKIVMYETASIQEYLRKNRKK